MAGPNETQRAVTQDPMSLAEETKQVLAMDENNAKGVIKARPHETVSDISTQRVSQVNRFTNQL